jgi:hypothetical protein
MTRNLGPVAGISYAVVCSGLSLVIPLCAVWYGFMGYVYTMLFGLLLHFIDVVTSDATATNIATMKHNGLSTSWIAFCWLYNWLTVISLPCIVFYYTCQDFQTHWDLRLVLQVAANLAATEALFTYPHRLMHRHMPQTHLLHHCVVRPSFFSNFLFHPVDLLLEFSAPVCMTCIVSPSSLASCCYLFILSQIAISSHLAFAVSTILLSLLLWKDSFTLLVSFGIQTAWYAAGHDEYLKLPHWYGYCVLKAFSSYRP